MGEDMQHITVEKQEGYLFVTFPAYESVSAMEQQISAMYDAVEQNHAQKVLVDFRATRAQVPIAELFRLCVYLVGKFVPVHPRIAVLASPEAVYHDRFGENVVRNRGLDLLRFVDNEQEALDWLFFRKPDLKP